MIRRALDLTFFKSVAWVFWFGLLSPVCGGCWQAGQKRFRRINIFFAVNQDLR